MANSLKDVLDALQRLQASVETSANSQRINPKQIAAVEGLSDIIQSLGTIRMGNFYALSSGMEPTELDCTGTFMSAIGKVFGSKTYHIGGVLNGDLKWGVNSETGELEAGDGAIVLSTKGVSVFSGATEVGRLGNLNGFLGISTDTFGIAIGSLTQYMMYDSTNGLRIMGVSLNGREILTANRNYYVDPVNGDDANSGLAADSAFLTIQHAVDTITSYLDLRNYDAIINLADGEYDLTNEINLTEATGTGAIQIVGNESTPASVLVYGVSGSSAVFTCKQSVTKYILNGIQVVNDTTSGAGIHVERGYIEVKNFDFGSTSGNQLEALFGGEIRIITGYTISGNAGNHMYAYFGGKIMVMTTADITITLNSNIFDVFAYASVLSIISFTNATNITFSGTATGTLYTSDYNSVIWAETMTLPGDVAGVTANGGLFF